MTINKKAYINSYDAVSCAGLDSEQLFASICEKKDCITINKDYVLEREVAIGQIDSDITFNKLLINSCKKVLETSNLDDYSNTLLVVGSSVGGMSETERIFFSEKSYKNIDYKKHPIDAIAYKLKEEFSFYDDISFSTACTSSANAVGYAKEVISKGIYKNVLVVGVDSLSYTTVCGFSALSVLSSKPCTPFEKQRDGMNVAEGIAVLLIQDQKEENSVEVCGVGYSSDAHHMTQPQPDGRGAVKAIENAIKSANVDKNKIKYINAHGTGTMANDSSELNAIVTVFAEANSPYVSSTKSFTGHTLGASGALEAIISVMVLQKQIIPPSKNIVDPERDDIVFINEALEEEISYVLSNSFAFGGNNTSLLFGLTNED